MKKTILVIVLLSAILASAGAEEAGKKTDNYFSVSPGFGITFPVGEYAAAFSLAYTPTVSAGYNLAFPWGILGFGISSGCNIQPTSAEAAYQSIIFSIPAAAYVRYTTNFASRLFAFIEAGGGIAVNSLHYTETYPGRSDYTSVKPYINPAAGFGVKLIPWLNISGSCGFMMIFYDDAVYMGITPGIRVGFDF
jgi:hypothetical protein